MKQASFLLGALGLGMVGIFGCGTTSEPGTQGDGDGDVPGSGGVSLGDGDGDGDEPEPEPEPESPCDEPLIELADFAGTKDAAIVVSEGADWGPVRGFDGEGTTLYILLDDALYSVEDGANERVLIADQIPPLSGTYLEGGRGRIRVNETHAYIATSAGLSRIALGDGTVEDLYDGNAESVLVVDLQIAGERLYYGHYGGGIYSLPLDGVEEPTFHTDLLRGRGFWIDGDLAYGADGSGYLASASLASGEVTRVTQHSQGLGPSFGMATVLDERVYWTDGNLLISCELPECGQISEHPGYNATGFVLSGGRSYGGLASLGWGSLTDDTCGLLVRWDDPYEVKSYGITDGYIYAYATLNSDEYRSVVFGLPLE